MQIRPCVQIEKDPIWFKANPKTVVQEIWVYYVDQEYKKTTSGNCVFVRKFFYDNIIFLLLYVDDILIIWKNISKIEKIKK